jgi:RHS repeat-associated protein
MAAILRNTEGEGDGGMGLGLGAPVVHVQGGGGAVAVLEAEGGAMLYGHGDVEEAFQPGHVTPGQEELTQSGALRFVVGERAYAAAYDGNGNMASRATEAGAQVLTWDAENRLVGYQSSASSASYAYDGDGVRVRTVITDSGGVTTTVHIGGTYEWISGSAARSYYYQGSQRVALREGGELYFLLGDHLGSTSVSYRVSDGQTVTQTYHAWGDIRPGPDNELPTDYAFTGQRLQSETGLYQMGARWYDALTGRWLSADTIVPGASDPQSLNRYTYVNNNPLRYIDCNGHEPGDVAGFLYGMLAQWMYDNLWFLPGLQQRYAPGQYESAATVAGRSVGNDLASLTGMAEVILGSEGTGGGCGISLTGGGAAVGVPVAAVSLVVVVHGAITCVYAETEGLKLMLMEARGMGAGGPRPEAPTGVGEWEKPPTDPNQSPGSDWEWRGSGPPESGRGSWYNSKTGEALHPDLDHTGPIDPHWDYIDPEGFEWRWYIDGSFAAKGGN